MVPPARRRDVVGAPRSAISVTDLVSRYGPAPAVDEAEPPTVPLAVVGPPPARARTGSRDVRPGGLVARRGPSARMVRWGALAAGVVVAAVAALAVGLVQDGARRAIDTRALEGVPVEPPSSLVVPAPAAGIAVDELRATTPAATEPAAAEPTGSPVTPPAPDPTPTDEPDDGDEPDGGGSDGDTAPTEDSGGGDGTGESGTDASATTDQVVEADPFVEGASSGAGDGGSGGEVTEERVESPDEGT